MRGFRQEMWRWRHKIILADKYTAKERKTGGRRMEGEGESDKRRNKER